MKYPGSQVATVATLTLDPLEFSSYARQSVELLASNESNAPPAGAGSYGAGAGSYGQNSEVWPLLLRYFHPLPRLRWRHRTKE